MHPMQKTLAALVFGVVLASLSLAPASAGESPRSDNAAARVNVGPTSVDWSPAVAYERLVLTIVGPEGFVNRQELDAGQAPTLSLFESNGKRLPDGLYRYELRLLPREGVGEGALTDRTVQRGALWIHDGAFVPPTSDKNAIASPASSTPPQIQDITGKDSVIPDDLVVQGTACIGPDCVNGDPDAHSLTLKGHVPSIRFDDIFCCAYPATYWVLQANEESPPRNDFIIRDDLIGTTPFRVQGGVPSYALVVGRGGFDAQEPRIGIGTQVPLKNLHVLNAATPTIRLEQPVSPGPARIWDVGANDTQFFVSDVTASSNQPFRIRAGAPTSSLDVSSTGKVGIGTGSPAQKLHVSGSDGTTSALVQEANATTALRTMLELKNNGASRLNITDTSVGNTWGINNVGGTLNILKSGAGVTAFALNGNGNLTIAGTLTQNSDRDTKRDLLPVRGDDVLAKLAALPLSTWNLKTDDPKVRHLGPMAQDFAAAFGLGEDERHIAPLDAAGVSLAAVQALDGKVTEIVREKDTEIAGLRRENAQLAERLAALEALIAEMAEK